GMPYHANTAIANGLDGFHGLLQGILHAKKLVIFGAYFYNVAFGRLVKNIVADIRQQSLRYKQTIDEGFQRKIVFNSREAIHRFPRSKPFHAAAEHAVQGGLSVAYHGKSVVLKQQRNVFYIMLHLVKSRMHIGIYIKEVFKFKEHQWQTVDKQNQIWP